MVTFNGIKRHSVHRRRDNDDYAHCTSCDVIINLDADDFRIIDDNTYCLLCADKEAYSDDGSK